MKIDRNRQARIMPEDPGSKGTESSGAKAPFPTCVILKVVYIASWTAPQK